MATHDQRSYSQERRLPGSRQPGNRAVEDVLRILEWISRHTDQHSVRRIAEDLGMSKTTVHRFLDILLSSGWFSRSSGDEQFSFGPKAMLFGAAALSESELRQVARPFLQQLRDETGESVFLGVRYEDEVIYVDRVETGSPVRYTERIGSRRPLHSTAAGKAILSALSDEELHTVVSRLTLAPYTPRTVTDGPALLEEILSTRHQGYALADEENRVGISGVGAPIVSRDGYVVGAVVVPGPSERIMPRVEALGRRTLQTALDIGLTMNATVDNGY